jgi:hypothetical protein
MLSGARIKLLVMGALTVTISLFSEKMGSKVDHLMEMPRLTEEKSSQEKYTLSICALFKNEARYLKEWIEYHLLIGVDHFYLYNNNSSDRFYEVLRPYVDRGIVSLIQWPDFLKSNREEDAYLWALGTQIPAYENAAKVKAICETKWLAFLDVEEFLIPAQDGSMKEVLAKYEEYPGITFMSDCYDASRLNAAVGRRFLIETVDLTSPPEQNRMKTVLKTIFKPRECELFLWPPYQLCFKEGKESVLADRRDVRINHYVNRFKGSLYYGKNKDRLDVDNRLISYDQTKQLLEEGYEILDQERLIFRFLPDMQKRIGVQDVKN